jgi:glycosyltransferase involved in cell wall biosynthesis
MAVNPIYTVAYSPQEIQKTVAELGVGESYILGVGTLEPRKNWPMLLKVYDVLRREYRISVPLVLVGGKGWKYREIFDTISRLGLDSHVLHLSGVSDVQLAHLYRSAGVLAFPSHYEGFGLPALEAMHAGCPVVASNRGSLPEVVGDAAISLDPDDLDGWVMALQLVLRDSEYAQSLALAGLNQARKFTWAKTAAATAAIYSAGSAR